MQSVEVTGLKQILRQWDKVLKEFPDAKRQMFESMGDTILSSVREKIGENPRKPTGKVKSWQDQFPGSGGGYIAFRAKPSMTFKGYNVGYITNAIENGHSLRSAKGPKSFMERMWPSMSHVVKGKHMYADTQPEAYKLAQQAADTLGKKLARQLEGKE